MLKALLLLPMLALCAHAADPVPYKPGEVIHYKISQMGLKAGEATLQFYGPHNIGRQKAILIVFKATGFNFFDVENIYLDPQTFKPMVVERDLNIFGKKEKIVERYGKGGITIEKTVGGKRTIQEIKTSEAIDNIYGFIYRYRAQGTFNVGEVLDINLPTKDLKITLAKRDKLAAGGTIYEAFYMASDPAQYRIWFDAGPNKIPLRISGAVGVGSTVMTMIKYRE